MTFCKWVLKMSIWDYEPFCIIGQAWSKRKSIEFLLIVSFLWTCNFYHIKQYSNIKDIWINIKQMNNPKNIICTKISQWIYFHTSISIICKKYLYHDSNTYHKALCIPILDYIFFLKSVDPPLLLVGNPGWFQSTLEYSGWDLGLR